MALSETQKGDWAIILGDVIWAAFPIVTIVSYKFLNPLSSLAYSTLFACAFFAVLLAARGKIKELWQASIYKDIFLIVFFIGWLFYILYFFGLKFTSAGNASIIDLMELFFSYLLFNVWKKQPFSGRQTAGALLMLFGALIILLPKQGVGFHGGDWLVLAATLCGPVGNYFQQRLRRKVSSETILFLRSLLSFPLFFLLAHFLGFSLAWAAQPKILLLILFNGVVVLGLSKILWIEGIHRISVTKATALNCATPLFTLFFAYIFFHQPPTVWQISSLIPLAAGLVLLTRKQQAGELKI